VNQDSECVCTPRGWAVVRSTQTRAAAPLARNVVTSGHQGGSLLRKAVVVRARLAAPSRPARSRIYLAPVAIGQIVRKFDRPFAHHRCSIQRVLVHRCHRSRAATSSRGSFNKETGDAVKGLCPVRRCSHGPQTPLAETPSTD
jgi:hypothetical protein